jgi:hypothetical protein
MIKKKIATALLDIITICWLCCIFCIPLIILPFVNHDIGTMVLITDVIFFGISTFVLIKYERLGSGVGAQC